MDPHVSPRPTFETLYVVARSYLPDALRLLGVPERDVPDLVHDVVLAADEALERRGGILEPVQGGAEPERTIKAWLSGVAWRLTANRRRRAPQRFELCCGDGDDLTGVGDEPPSSEQLVALKQRCRLLREVLSRLRPERREVLSMYALLEMPIEDIATALGLNENTVKSRLGRARSDFVAIMKRLQPDEQRALEGSPLLVPFGLLDWQRSPPSAAMGTSGGTAAAALGTLALALGIGLGWSARGGKSEQAPPIAAVREATPVEPMTGAPNAVVPAVNGAPFATSQPRAVATGSARRPPGAALLDEEQMRIGAARRAFRAGAYERALEALASHEQQFLHGGLAGEREWLRAEVRAAMAMESASAPAE